MDDKLTVVTDALAKLNKLGYCHIVSFRVDEIKIVKDTLKQCDKEWSSIEGLVATSIFLK